MDEIRLKVSLGDRSRSVGLGVLPTRFHVFLGCLFLGLFSRLYDTV